jgi:peptide/nickel transport system permease protein
VVEPLALLLWGCRGVASFALFLLKRLLGIAVLVWATTLAAFGLFRLGVPSPVVTAQIDRQLGSGEPVSSQYLHYLQRLLHGNLGDTLTVGLSVDGLLRRALPPTLSLIIGGMVLWLVAGVLAGTVSALRPGSLTDRVVTGAVLAAVTAPTFLLGVLLLDLFVHLSGVGITWFQPGYVPISHSPVQWLGRMILPWIAVAGTQAGTTARLTRASVLEVLGEDYTRAGRAKGLTRDRLFWVHVLRPSMLPVVASAGAGFGVLLGAAAIIDQVFALGGFGQILLAAVGNGDLMVVLGVVLLTVILISVVNLIADLCQAMLDPRIRVT